MIFSLSTNGVPKKESKMKFVLSAVLVFLLIWPVNLRSDKFLSRRLANITNKVKRKINLKSSSLRNSNKLQRLPGTHFGRLAANEAKSKKRHRQINTPSKEPKFVISSKTSSADFIDTSQERKMNDCAEIGTVFFSELAIFSDIFVDKSLLIRDFLQLPNQITIITRPKRWGKTVNTDMLKTFFQLEPPSQSRRKSNRKSSLSSSIVQIKINTDEEDEQQKTRRQLFTGGKIVMAEGFGRMFTKHLKRLKISDYPEAMKLQGRSPVIFLTLAGFVGTTYVEVENELKLEIRDLFLEHGYLQNIALLSADEGKMFDAYTKADKKKKKNGVKRKQLEYSLLFLSELLHRHFKTKVYIFIDDFDVPIINTLKFWRPGTDGGNSDKYSTNYDELEEEEEEAQIVDESIQSEQLELVVQLFRRLFGNCLVDNPNLEKALITGVFPTIADILVDVNDNNCSSNVCSLLSENCTLDQYYGFTAIDVDSLLLSNTSVDRRERNLLNCRYKYHLIGKRKQFVIYNPWSISWYVKNRSKERAFRNYWLENTESSLSVGILTSDRLQSDVRNLIAGRPIYCRISDSISLNLNDSSSSSSSEEESIRRRQTELSVLLHAGYLTSSGYNDSTSVYRLTVPNAEVVPFYERKLEHWLDAQRVITYNGWLVNNFNPLMDLLLTDRLEQLDNRLNYIIFDQLDCYYYRGNNDEENHTDLDRYGRVYYIISKFLLLSYDVEVIDDYDNELIIILRSLSSGRYDKNAIVKIKMAHTNDAVDLKRIAEEQSSIIVNVDKYRSKTRGGGHGDGNKFKIIIGICFAFNGKMLRVAGRNIDYNLS